MSGFAFVLRYTIFINVLEFSTRLSLTDLNPLQNNDPSRHKFQNSPTTVTAFHGTSLASADLILKHGASSNVTNCGQYGRGFYVGCGRLGIPIKYAFDKYFGPTLIIGSYARGWFSRTETNSVFPEDNRDSGGCGNDWIGTMMNNNYMFYPEHVVEIRRATKEVCFFRFFQVYITSFCLRITLHKQTGMGRAEGKVQSVLRREAIRTSKEDER